MSGNSRRPNGAEPVISLTMKTPVTLAEKRAEPSGCGFAPPTPPTPPPHLLLICRRLSTVSADVQKKRP